MINLFFNFININRGKKLISHTVKMIYSRLSGPAGEVLTHIYNKGGNANYKYFYPSIEPGKKKFV